MHNFIHMQNLLNGNKFMHSRVLIMARLLRTGIVMQGLVKGIFISIREF